MIECRKCEYWVPDKVENPTEGDCHGVPPKPVAMPVKSLRGVEIQVRSFLPRTKGDSPGCGIGVPTIGRC